MLTFLIKQRIVSNYLWECPALNTSNIKPHNLATEFIVTTQLSQSTSFHFWVDSFIDFRIGGQNGHPRILLRTWNVALDRVKICQNLSWFCLNIFVFLKKIIFQSMEDLLLTLLICLWQPFLWCFPLMLLPHYSTLIKTLHIWEGLQEKIKSAIFIKIWSFRMIERQNQGICGHYSKPPYFHPIPTFLFRFWKIYYWEYDKFTEDTLTWWIWK